MLEWTLNLNTCLIGEEENTTILKIIFESIHQFTVQS